MNGEIRTETVGNAIVQSSLGSFVAKVSGVLSSVIIFRSLDPATYGEWRLALALTALLLGWLTAMTAVITVEAIRSLRATDAKDGLVMWRGYVRVTILAALVACGIGAVFARPIAAFLKVGDWRLIILAFVLVLCWLIKSHAVSWFAISYRFRDQLRIQVFESLTYLAMLSFFLLFQHKGAWGLGLANVFAAFFVSVVAAPFLIRGLRTAPSATVRREIVLLLHLLRQHGKWALAVDGLKDALDAGRIWIIGFLLGPAAVGLYGLADSLFGHLVSLINIAPAISASLPRFVNDRPRLSAAVSHAIRVGSLVSVGTFFLSWAAVPFFIPLLFPKFSPAIPLFLVLSFGLLLTGLSVVLNTLYPALRRQKVLFGFLSIRVAISFLVLITLVPFIGIWAVGVEGIIGPYVYASIRWLWLKKHLSMEESSFFLIFPRKPDVREVADFVRKKAHQGLARFGGRA